MSRKCGGHCKRSVRTWAIQRMNHLYQRFQTIHLARWTGHRSTRAQCAVPSCSALLPLDLEEAVGFSGWMALTQMLVRNGYLLFLSSFLNICPCFMVASACLRVCFARGLSNEADLRHLTFIVRPIGSKIASLNRLVAKTYIERVCRSSSKITHGHNTSNVHTLLRISVSETFSSNCTEIRTSAATRW